MAVNYSDLLDPKLEAQFNLGLEALKPIFEEQRSAIGTSLASTGLRRTGGSAYQTSLLKQLSNEQTQVGTLLSTMLGEQTEIDESKKSRDWQTEENRLNRENAITLAKISGDYNLSGIEASADAAEKSAEKSAVGSGLSGIASVITAFLLA